MSSVVAVEETGDSPNARVPGMSFNKARLLSPERKSELFHTQALRLDVQEWEEKCILDLCFAKMGASKSCKGWIDKGLALLFKYASYVDEIANYVGQRVPCGHLWS
jgi:hypothetical protein